MVFKSSDLCWLCNDSLLYILDSPVFVIQCSFALISSLLLAQAPPLIETSWRMILSNLPVGSGRLGWGRLVVRAWMTNLRDIKMILPEVFHYGKQRRIPSRELVVPIPTILVRQSFLSPTSVFPFLSSKGV